MSRVLGLGTGHGGAMKSQDIFLLLKLVSI